MINTNILNMLKSNSLAPSYSVIISDFKQPEFCDRDKLQIITHQISPSLFDIINQQSYNINKLKQALSDNNIAIPDINDITINNIVSKTLNIESGLVFDSNSDMFTSQLTGSVSNETNLPTPSSHLQGYVTKRRINITTKDSPVILSHNNFEIKNKQVIINIDQNKINSATVTISHDDIYMNIDQTPIKIPFNDFIVNNIENNKITINMEDIINQLTDCTAINTINEQIEEYEASIEESDDEEEIATLEAQRDALIERLNYILVKLNGLNFSSAENFNINVDYTLKPDISGYSIETIGFMLQSQINIDFMHAYSDLPSVIITIDKKDKIYSSYDTVFKTNSDNEYIGVQINFNNLRRIKNPIQVNAIIIGDRSA